jgi:hypothetical protein
MGGGGWAATRVKRAFSVIGNGTLVRRLAVGASPFGGFNCIVLFGPVKPIAAHLHCNLGA